MEKPTTEREAPVQSWHTEKRSLLFLDPFSPPPTLKNRVVKLWEGLSTEEEIKLVKTHPPGPLASQLTFGEWHRTTFFFHDLSFHPEDTIKVER